MDMTNPSLPVQSASPLESAAILLRAGASLPRHLIMALLNEGHDIAGLVRSIKPAHPALSA